MAPLEGLPAPVAFKGSSRCFNEGCVVEMTEPAASPVSYKIRIARLEDITAIATILRELGWFRHLEQETASETEERMRQHLQHCLSSNAHLLLVAESDKGDVLGYTSVHWISYLTQPGPEGFVSEVFVKASARGQGIGGALLEAVKEKAVERGCARLSLMNRRSRPSFQRGFYPKHGWVERADMANFVFVFKEE